jgi:hypothetical protein
MRHAQWFASRIKHAFGPRCGPIGIEYRDGFVRMVQVVRERRSQIVASACVAYDQEAPERSIEQVEHALRGSDFRGRECVVVLPFDAVRTAIMAVEDGSDEAILETIRGTLPKRFGMERAQCDFIRLGALEHGLCEVTAIVADRTRVERIVLPLIDAGYWPSAVEPSFAAVARTANRTSRRASDRARVRLAVDLHANGATAMLVQGQTILHSTTCDRRANIVHTIFACYTEGQELFGACDPMDVRLAGTNAYDPELVEDVERSIGVRVGHDDEVGMLAAAYAQIGVHAIDRGGAAAWAGAIGAAFRPQRANASSNTERDRAAHALPLAHQQESDTARREAA